MKKFLKDNHDIISKLVVYQIGITVFGYLLYITAAVSKSAPLMLGLGIFSAVFYLSLIYVHVWELGSHDKIRIEAGRMKFDMFKGLKAALIANIPTFILALTSTFGYIMIDRTITDTQGRFTTPAWATGMYSISQIIGFYWNSMYAGIGEYMGIELQPFYLFIVPIPAILVSFIAYYFGTKEKFGLFPNK